MPRSATARNYSVVRYRRSKRGFQGLLITAFATLAIALSGEWAQAQTSTTVIVAANVEWFDTGIDVQAGGAVFALSINATGNWTNVAGGQLVDGAGYGSLLPNAIAPTLSFASLIGRVNGTIFGIGRSFSQGSPASGRLFLSMNDVPGTYDDNAGQLTVVVTQTANKAPTDFTVQFGQCPPVPEGSLPQSGKDIARHTLVVKNANQPSAKVLTESRIPVDVTSRTRLIADAAVIASDTNPRSSRPPKGKGLAGKDAVPSQDAGFPGPVLTDVPAAGLSSNIVEQDGKFIIVGGSDSFTGQVVEQGIFLARFAADGTPDASFGQGGSTRIILFAANKMANNTPVSVALSPSGKIVVARSINDMFPGNQPGKRVAVARLEADGSLDSTFGSGGLIHTTIGNYFDAFAVAVQRDDRVLVSGRSGHIGDCRDEPCVRLATLMRYQSNGQPDPTFGTGGLAQAKLLIGGPPPVLSTESSFSSLFVQENGLIVAAGQVQTGTGSVRPTRMLVAEYLPTGELNPAFGSSGVVTLMFDGPYQQFGASSLAFHENGKIFAGGSASLYEGTLVGTPEEVWWLVDQAFVLARLTPGGELDSTFGNSGKLVVDVNPRVGGSTSRPLDQLSNVILGPSEDIYAVGIASGPVGTSDAAIELVALGSDGSLKQHFGNAGLYSFGTYSPWRMKVGDDALLTTAGRLVVSGTHWPDSRNPDAFVLWAFSVSPKSGQPGCP